MPRGRFSGRWAVALLGLATVVALAVVLPLVLSGGGGDAPDPPLLPIGAPSGTATAMPSMDAPTSAPPPAPTGSPASAPSPTPVSEASSSSVIYDLGGRFDDPPQVTIVKGTTVVWRNNSAIPQNVESCSQDDLCTRFTGEWASGDIPPGDTYARTFDAPGVFDYRKNGSSSSVSFVFVVAEEPVVGTGPAVTFDLGGVSDDPPQVTIVKGMTVIWVNGAAFRQNLESCSQDDLCARFTGGWASGDIPPGGAYARTFDAPGVFDYRKNGSSASASFVFVVAEEPVVGTGPEVTFVLGGESDAPPEITLVKGTTVIWVNNAAFPQNVESCSQDDLCTRFTDEWASGDIPPGGTYARTFDTSGVFDYRKNGSSSLTSFVLVTER